MEAIEALALYDAPVVQANFNMMDVRAITSAACSTKWSRHDAGLHRAHAALLWFSIGNDPA